MLTILTCEIFTQGAGFSRARRLCLVEKQDTGLTTNVPLMDMRLLTAEATAEATVEATMEVAATADTALTTWMTTQCTAAMGVAFDYTVLTATEDMRTMNKDTCQV